MVSTFLYWIPLLKQSRQRVQINKVSSRCKLILAPPPTVFACRVKIWWRHSSLQRVRPPRKVVDCHTVSVHSQPPRKVQRQPSSSVENAVTPAGKGLWSAALLRDPPWAVILSPHRAISQICMARYIQYEGFFVFNGINAAYQFAVCWW